MVDYLKIVPGACPNCRGNIVLIEDSLSSRCEDCGREETAPNLRVFRVLLETKAKTYCSKENRIPLTVAGQILVSCLRDKVEPSGDLVEMADSASRGIPLEPNTIELLKKGGFIV